MIVVKDGRCQGDERIIGPAFADDVFIDEEAGAEEHEDAQKERRRTQHGQGHVENALGAEIVLFRYFSAVMMEIAIGRPALEISSASR